MPDVYSEACLNIKDDCKRAKQFSSYDTESIEVKQRDSRVKKKFLALRSIKNAMQAVCCDTKGASLLIDFLEKSGTVNSSTNCQLLA